MVENQVITKVICCSFRRDGLSVTFGLDSGFKMYDVTERGLLLQHECTVLGGIKLISEISNCDITQGRKFVALVGTGQNKDFPENKCIFWHVVEQRSVASKEFANKLLKIDTLDSV